MYLWICQEEWIYICSCAYMYMNIFMYVSVWIDMCLFLCVWLCKLVHVFVFNWNHFEMRLLNLRTIIFIYCTSICACINGYMCAYICMYVWMCVYLCVYGYMCVYIWIYILIAQRIEALSLYGSRWALSEDSSFKSYPSRAEVYLVKNVVR